MVYRKGQKTARQQGRLQSFSQIRIVRRRWKVPFYLLANLWPRRNTKFCTALSDSIYFLASSKFNLPFYVIQFSRAILNEASKWSSRKSAPDGTNLCQEFTHWLEEKRFSVVLAGSACSLDTLRVGGWLVRWLAKNKFQTTSDDDRRHCGLVYLRAGGLTACSTVEFVMQSWSRLQQTTAPVHHGKPLN